jgi:hypothetical protein
MNDRLVVLVMFYTLVTAAFVAAWLRAWPESIAFSLLAMRQSERLGSDE